ncbi:MAG: hypothetical protein JWR20_2072 [Marmoricola sp.]|nr:hypothetical protein [Marmoricola sp.]
MTVVDGLIQDLAAEAADLQEVLEGLDAATWSAPTPALGWTVHDQVAHLAHFDWVTRLAVSRPDTFVALRDSLGATLPDLQTYVDSIGPANGSRDSVDMLRWWREQGRLLREAVIAAPSGARVPWFGPPMSLASKVTARIMETWAHGQDVVDTVGVTRTATDRLRHVARIGVLAMPNSFTTHGQQVPVAPVRVALKSPSGGTWEWGDPEAADLVSGDALDFCLVVTQRRHVADTGLAVTGPTATAWIQVAQAFAGPPGPGRAAGQFTGGPR